MPPVTLANRHRVGQAGGVPQFAAHRHRLCPADRPAWSRPARWRAV